MRMLFFSVMLILVQVGAVKIHLDGQSVHSVQAVANGFRTIAHMANTNSTVAWAIGEGADGVEIDLNYEGTTPVRIKHSKTDKITDACDCTCTPVVINRARYICTPLQDSCTAGENAWAFMNFLAGKKLNLVYMDNKVHDDWSDSQQEEAGGKAAKMYEKLFENGHPGIVLVGVPQKKYIVFLKAVKAAFDSTKYEGRVFFTIDMETGAQAASDTIAKLKTLNTNNLVYSVGISACAPMTYYNHIKYAVSARERGEIKEVLIWTIDTRSSMQKYIELGVNGILSNYPGYLKAEAEKEKEKEKEKLLGIRHFLFSWLYAFFPRRSLYGMIPFGDA